eukprot:scaffold17876_cov132-Isochrysis_galbana.AAC.6
MGIHPPLPTLRIQASALLGPYWVLVCVSHLSCVSWVRRWPRTGLANRPPLCLPDPPPPYPLPRASNALRPVRGVVMSPVVFVY